MKGDGTVEGSFQVNSRGQDAKARGDILCLHIEGNTAYLKGAITKGDFAGVPLEGFFLAFKMQDNGEGENAPSEMATDLESPGPGFDPTCNKAFLDNLLTLSLEEGDIHVKP